MGNSVNVSWPGVDPADLKRRAAERGIRETGTPWPVSEYIRRAVEAYGAVEETSEALQGEKPMDRQMAKVEAPEDEGEGVYRLTELGAALAKHPTVREQVDSTPAGWERREVSADAGFGPKARPRPFSKEAQLGKKR